MPQDVIPVAFVCENIAGIGKLFFKFFNVSGHRRSFNSMPWTAVDGSSAAFSPEFLSVGGIFGFSLLLSSAGRRRTQPNADICKAGVWSSHDSVIQLFAYRWP